MSKVENLIGQKFGRLTVVARGEKSKGGKTRWKCICDCGKEKTKPVCGYDLKSGKVKSCGCLVEETTRVNGKKNARHGDAHSRLWRIWQGMRARCDNAKTVGFCNYGGRGITYCPEWREYELFREWALNNGYQETLTLERIDSDKNYCPENCTWATMKEQQNNRRNTIRFSVNSEEHSVSEWADISGISSATLTWRLRHGWSEDEIFMPVNLNNKNIRKQKEID